MYNFVDNVLLQNHLDIKDQPGDLMYFKQLYFKLASYKKPSKEMAITWGNDTDYWIHANLPGRFVKTSAIETMVFSNS